MPEDTDGPSTAEELEDCLTRPTPETVAAVQGLRGDLLILGAGGKMGPTLARLAMRCVSASGTDQAVIAVSRFGDAGMQRSLDAAGVRTVAIDLLAPGALEALPDVPNVVFMAGMKFGTSGSPAMTWALNCMLPGLVVRRFRQSRIVVLSTGNVYPLVPVESGGATEDTPPAPIGEYAQSCLGRERMFEYGALTRGTRSTLVRLNYANDLRYGVLLDIAARVRSGAPIDLTMGYLNAIWQGDANAAVLRSFSLCANPPSVLNLTGPGTASVRDLAQRFAALMDVPPPVFTGAEAPTALLSNAARYVSLFGPPRVSLEMMVRWTAHWLEVGGPTLSKPTHFEEREGHF